MACPATSPSDAKHRVLHSRRATPISELCYILSTCALAPNSPKLNHKKRGKNKSIQNLSPTTIYLLSYYQAAVLIKDLLAAGTRAHLATASGAEKCPLTQWRSWGAIESSQGCWPELCLLRETPSTPVQHFQCLAPVETVYKRS